MTTEVRFKAVLVALSIGRAFAFGEWCLDVAQSAAANFHALIIAYRRTVAYPPIASPYLLYTWEVSPFGTFLSRSRCFHDRHENRLDDLQEIANERANYLRQKPHATYHWSNSRITRNKQVEDWFEAGLLNFSLTHVSESQLCDYTHIYPYSMGWLLGSYLFESGSSLWDYLKLF
ncbi:hypothetical protein DTO027B5_6393 [Paecilomyces variotii]|nr:hypothetical protein DTO169C6_5997 [Paecilomyces variotii]KAJ9256246.1 hypothetical protein DTO195F2_5971 [Paecilomyces variotii]KAJ9329793.1 hypothetical protein DTO027B3_280 [Paecilomyces variotii]KAJ9331862.1 hypothetical protein DTO027B5_6393 [Paecilomyces variotii]KAJ9395714.1 hypothetical protein DTO282F9_7334 [Paecilomyces variotii]